MNQANQIGVKGDLRKGPLHMHGCLGEMTPHWKIPEIAGTQSSTDRLTIIYYKGESNCWLDKDMVESKEDWEDREKPTKVGINSSHSHQ